jgi:hypothetical protein
MARANRSRTWFDTVLDFVAANPKMSAAIAFELGVLAAEAAKAAGNRRNSAAAALAQAPARIMNALPDIPLVHNLQTLVGSPRKTPAKRAASTRRKKAKSRSQRRRAPQPATSKESAPLAASGS